MLSRALAALVTAVAAAALTAPAARADGGGGAGNCGAGSYPLGYDVSCQTGTIRTGAGGNTRPPGTRTTGGVSTPCALYPVAGNPGQMLQVCPHGLLLAGGRNGVSLLNATSTVLQAGTGAPAVTPQELLAWASNELALPLPDVRTARPRGTEALVGLPEWFWIAPAQWHPVTAAVSAGGVWARVTARPAVLDIRSGDGGGMTCRGPGTAYDTRLPARAQHSTCAWTYDQPSAGLPGNRYQVSVTVTWTAAWHGSGGAGGTLPALARTLTFELAVGEAQALIQGS
jgi:hypothetical protein